MALQELVDGECGGRNPLLKVASHFTQDKGFRQEHLHFAPSASRSLEQEDDIHMVREFLDAPSQMEGSRAFHMGALLQEMRELEQHKTFSSSIQPGPNIAQIALQANWADEFLSSEHEARGGGSVYDFNGASGWSNEFLDQPRFMASEYADSSEWDSQWDDLISHVENRPAKIDQAEELRRTANQMVNTMTDPKFAQSEFLQFLKKVSDGEETLNAASSDSVALGESWTGEFTSTHPGPAASASSSDWVSDFAGAPSADLADQWSQEFTGGPSAEVFRSDMPSQEDFWSQLQRDWETAADENPSAMGWLKDPLSDSSQDYSFESENPYQNHSDPFNIGLQKKAEGDLPSAILLFEAALQKDPDHMKAWELLGLSLAENEQDPGAITAYKRCLALEPSNLVAIMGLAVSYTNESYQLQACKALEDWLKNNPKYAHLVSSAGARPRQQDQLVSSLVTGDTFNHVQDMYLRAARLQPALDMDPDVQTGLGVLLNLSSDFDKASDCFRAALEIIPTDSLLWNRLGATLANGGRSEEAVQAYYKALELSPGFIRARYNLAVSCINLGAHREAAEHLVSALVQQSSRSKRVMSDNIWSTLRMVLNLMNRREFLGDIDARDLTRLAAEFGIVE